MECATIKQVEATPACSSKKVKMNTKTIERAYVCLAVTVAASLALIVARAL
jgi:hypothetical protein